MRRGAGGFKDKVFLQLAAVARDRAGSTVSLQRYTGSLDSAEDDRAQGVPIPESRRVTAAMINIRSHADFVGWRSSASCQRATCGVTLDGGHAHSDIHRFYPLSPRSEERRVGKECRARRTAGLVRR